MKIERGRRRKEEARTLCDSENQQLVTTLQSSKKKKKKCRVFAFVRNMSFDLMALELLYSSTLCAVLLAPRSTN